MTFSSKFAVKSSVRLSTKKAWAVLVRRRWPSNTVKMAMIEWGLTEGQAKGLVAAQASHNTIDHIEHHPNGGFALGLLILEIKMQTAVTDFIQQEQGRLENEERKSAERRAHLRAMARDLPSVLGLDRDSRA